MPDILIRGYKAKEQIEEIIQEARYAMNNSMVGSGLEIIELPPHGDLIDRAPLVQTFNERAEKEGWAYLDDEDLDDAPVIVPASEGGADG